MSALNTLPAGIPGWQHAPCLGCGERVTGRRDAHVIIGGTRDGSVLLIMDVEPQRSYATRPELLERSDLYLLGVAHRMCIELGRRRLEGQSVTLPDALPRLLSEPEFAPLERLDLPPRLDMCPFCGGTKEMSDEDVWPGWVSNAIRDQTGGFTTKTPYGQRRSRFIRSLVKICRPCNNEWLSVLENDTKPALVDLVQGLVPSRELSVQEQKLVARWAVKTALMLALGAERRIIPLGYYQEFRQKREPLPSTTVRLAAYCGSERAAWAQLAPLFLGSPEPETPNGFVCTFTAYRVVFQVWGHFTGDSVTLHDDRSSFADAFHRIWPTGNDTILWPHNGVAFGDEALTSFAAEAAEG